MVALQERGILACVAALGAPARRRPARFTLVIRRPLVAETVRALHTAVRERCGTARTLPRVKTPIRTPTIWRVIARVGALLCSRVGAAPCSHRAASAASLFPRDRRTCAALGTPARRAPPRMARSVFVQAGKARPARGAAAPHFTHRSATRRARARLCAAVAALDRQTLHRVRPGTTASPHRAQLPPATRAA